MRKFNEKKEKKQHSYSFQIYKKKEEKKELIFIKKIIGCELYGNRGRTATPSAFNLRAVNQMNEYTRVVYVLTRIKS